MGNVRTNSFHHTLCGWEGELGGDVGGGIQSVGSVYVYIKRNTNIEISAHALYIYYTCCVNS